MLAGTSLTQALAVGRQGLDEADSALLQQIAYGVLRDWRLLEHVAGRLTREPPRPELLASLLAVGIYQLRSLRVPAYAAVSSTVAATDELKLQAARGLVNAVLRRYQREHSALEAALPDSPALRFSHPDWLAEQLRSDWPRNSTEILAANNEPAPMWLRVNMQGISRDAYLEQLRSAGHEAQACEHAQAALKLAQAAAVTDLPGFAEGLVSVQDAAAQLAVQLLDAGKGMRVLDACAAPGGKAAHLLERDPDLELLALDVDATRLQRVQETFTRLGLRGQILCGDAVEPRGWWDGKLFDRILLDAPCSGTGVIRRHPDIKWLRRARDIPKLAGRQLGMLRALWPLLEPGGRLLYAVCSSLTAEGDAVIAQFLANTPDVRAKELELACGERTQHGRRIAPGDAGMDGFYYASLQKAGG